MQIGTAAPSPKELAAAKHHFIHHKSITDDYSVGNFENDALQCLHTLFKTQNIVILVGGSGLYIDAVTKGLDYFPSINPAIRAELNTKLATKGLSYLQTQLKQLDSQSYNTVALKNPHRVIRALEVCLGTGKPYSSFLNQGKQQRKFKVITIGLNAERDIIYNRINQRVDLMVAQGLLNEVKSLIAFKNLNALNTVGYKELFKYYNGDYTLEFAIAEIKKNTRRFAKRQGTWFRKNKNILWFNYQDNVSNILNAIEQKSE